MAGGFGARVWPLFIAAHPKQFLRLHCEGIVLRGRLTIGFLFNLAKI